MVRAVRNGCDINAARAGLLAHLLMPHAPYVFDANCSETGDAVVGYFLRKERSLEGADLERVRAESYHAYQAQYRCLLQKLAGLLAGVDSMPEFKDATIVVHGDHGPRISAGLYAEGITERDMVDNYSALYAIRRPDLVPGYDTRKTSVQRLNSEYFREDSAVLEAGHPTVAIESKEPGRVLVRPMPDFGAAGS